MTEFSVIVPDLDLQAACAICGANFVTHKGSRRLVCSHACQRERGRRYSLAYGAAAREKRQKMLDLFGGQMPTLDDIKQIINARKEPK